MTRLAAQEWRVLTALYRAAPSAGLRGVSAAKLCEQQHANRDHLANLEARGYLTAAVDAIEVKLDDIAGGHGLHAVTVTLTRKGQTKVETDPLSRAVNALVAEPGSTPLLSLRTHASITDAELRELEAAGVITAHGTDAEVALAIFRRIPPTLLIRLTGKGRQYHALPADAVIPGAGSKQAITTGPASSAPSTAPSLPDPLRIAGRIQLGPGERFAGSASAKDGEPLRRAVDELGNFANELHVASVVLKNQTDLQFDDRGETPALTVGAIGAGALVPATTAAATPVGDVSPAGPGGVYFGADDDDDAVYLDWSSHREDGARGLEVGGGGEGVVIEVTPTDLRDLRDELARTLARDAADLTVAGDLVAGDGNDALYPRGQRDAYLDWSTRNDDGSRNVEVGAGDEAVVVRLDREQLQELHDAIGEQIIADRANVDPGEVRAGQLVFDAVTARLPDRAPGEKYDITARLELDQDPGWRDRTAAATERALRLYRCSTYREVAAYLRAGDDYVDANLTIREHPGRAPTRESVTTHVALIDQAMEAAPLKAPVQLWRGVRDAPAVFGDQWRENMVGAQWTEESFPSTSADPQVGLVFADEVLLRLHVPAGVGAVQLSSWTNRQNANREAEVLLERRLRMRVVADQVEPVGEGGGVTYHGTGDDMQMRVAPPPTRRVLDVEVTPAPPDDDEEPEPAAPAVGPALSSDERRAQAWPIADSEALTDHERLTRPTAPAADQPTPQWRHIVTQQEPPAPTRSAEPIRLPNNGADQGLMHLDSAIGVAWQQLGDDRHLDVGGHALGNILTDLGEGITLNRHTSSHALDRLRELRDRVPAGGRAAQVLDRAVARLDAPHRPEPELPAGTPEPLRTLMRELNAIPLVRRGGDTGYGGGEVWHETDRLADAARRWMAGELSPARFEGELEQLSMGRHEMAEGYTEIREAFGRALGTYRQWRLPPTRTNRSQET